MLANCAFDFAVSHELAHIAGNHISLGDIAVAGVISEIRDEGLGGVRSQCLELNADSWAILRALELADRNFNNVRHGLPVGPPDPHWRAAMATAFSSFQSAFYMVLFAVYVFFDLLIDPASTNLNHAA